MYQVSGLLKLLSNHDEGNSNSQFNKKSQKIIELYLQDYKEDEIVRLLYVDKVDKANFRKLKSRMIEELCTRILKNIDKIEFRNEYSQKLFSIQKLIIVGQLLILKDFRTAGVPLLKRAFRMASDLENTQYIIQCAKLLSHSSIFQRDKKGFKFFTNVTKKQSELYQIENEIEEDYSSILIDIIDVAEFPLETKRRVQILFDKIKHILQHQDSYTLQVLYFLISIRYYYSISEFHSVRLVSQRAIYYLNSKSKNFLDVRAGEFSLHEMESCLRLQIFKEARECVQKCSKYFIAYSTNWSIFYEYYFLLAMRTGNFKRAKDILELVNKSQYKLKKMNKLRIEKWHLYSTYLIIMLNDGRSNSFKLYKYLNEINILQRDKAGYNFTILISKIILLILAGKQDELLSLEDSLKLYLRRYVKFDQHPRHYIFGTFMIALFKNDFKAIEPDKFINKLNKVQNLEETEIVPYEVLLQHLVESI